jgi:nucleoside 2-deoxyribosyltransferase
MNAVIVRFKLDLVRASMSYFQNCPICSQPANQELVEPEAKNYLIECRDSCGIFTVNKEAQFYLSDRDRNAAQDAQIIAFLLHKLKTPRSFEKIVHINLDLVKQALDNPELPKAIEQADNLILWLGSKNSNISKFERIEINNLIPIIGSIHWDDVCLIIRYLWEKGLIDFPGSRLPELDTHVILQLKIPGWERFDELDRKAAKPIAFMAMKFEKEDVQKAFSQFQNASKTLDFDLLTLTERQEAGIIHNRMKVQIQKSRFVIADLTYQNQGVYWEAGYAEGLKIPVIYTCKSEDFSNIHFDIKPSLTVKWSLDQNSPYYIDEAIKELQATIVNTLGLDPRLYN